MITLTTRRRHWQPDWAISAQILTAEQQLAGRRLMPRKRLIWALQRMLRAPRKAARDTTHACPLRSVDIRTMEYGCAKTAPSSSTTTLHDTRKSSSEPGERLRRITLSA